MSEYLEIAMCTRFGSGGRSELLALVNQVLYNFSLLGIYLHPN